MDFGNDSSLEEVSIAWRGNELTSYLAMANFEDLTKRLEATENYRQSQILTGCLLRRSGPR